MPLPHPLAIALASALASAAVAAAGCAAEERSASGGPPGGQAASGGPTAGSGAGGGDGDGGGGTGGATAIPPCDAFGGPFGSEPDEILDPTLAWEGFPAGEGDVDVVELSDYVACSGNLETRALIVYVDALWCSICRDVASDLAQKYEDDWRARGVEVITLVVEDADGNPADIEAAWQWRQTFGLEEMAVLADGDYLLRNAVPHTLPQAIIVDPRTMRVVDRPIGKVDLDPLLDEFLEDE